jgi:hypothetical protein
VDSLYYCLALALLLLLLLQASLHCWWCCSIPSALLLLDTLHQ